MGDGRCPGPLGLGEADGYDWHDGPFRRRRIGMRPGESVRLPHVPTWTSIGAILTFAWLLVLAACGTKATTGHTQASRLSRETRLHIPSRARVLQFFEPDSIVDPAWAAKLEIPRLEQEGLLRSLAEKPSDKTSVRNRLSLTVPWWQPRERIAAKQYLADRNTLVNVVIAREGASIVAYVELMVF